MEILLLASFKDIATYTGYVLLAILILMVMITVHEFGHYIAGKIFKFGIEEFAIGFGPKIFKKQLASGEVFSLRALPIGGFCAFKGEDKDDDDPSAFNNKKPWQRIIVLISGALMNYLLALLVIALMFGIYGQSAIMVGKTQENSSYPQNNSFYERDVILSVEGESVYMLTDIMDAISGKKQGDLLKFTVLRSGKQESIEIILRADTDFKNVEDMKTLYSALGVYHEIDEQSGELINGGFYATGVKYGLFKTICKSFEYSIKLAGTVFTVLGQLLTGALGLSSVGGTVTTITVTADAIMIGGFRYLLNITSFIGVNLAVFNLLPFPALDGSRVVFTAIEGVRKKPLNRRVEGIIHTVGLLVILIFAIFIDLYRCF